MNTSTRFRKTIKNLYLLLDQLIDFGLEKGHYPHDSGYRGEIHAIISNVSTLTQSLYKNTRVGQIVITPVVIADFVLDLGESRDTGAFGSSGI